MVVFICYATGSYHYLLETLFNFKFDLDDK
jgi:hypothetical protein